MRAAPADRTLPRLLARQAERWPERPLIAVDGRVLSVETVRALAARRAAQLLAAGLAPGERLAMMSENRLEVIELWLGCAWAGIVAVPVNSALRGAQLGHVLADSGARALALERELRPALALVATPLPALETTWEIEELPPALEEAPPHRARASDTATILYTSGTTGPSKGVLCPHAQWYWWGVLTAELLRVDAESVLYTGLPLFHVNALNTLCQALVTGATFGLGPRFSASAFWQRLVDSDATHTYLLGPMVSILLRRPPSPLERAHRVRIALAPATPGELHAPFRERFGIELVDGWGSTETNFVLGDPVGKGRPGTMGRVRPEFEARVVDDDDVEVPDGTAGELVVRAREPFSFATGYLGLPEKTVEAWRNLWFHTGDRVVRDGDGRFRFVDRLKDSIRRRGENISSFEVEQALLAHPDVAAAAAVAVPSELGEDEVLAVVVPRPDAAVDPAALVRFLEGRLAYFAIPRYVEVVDDLPLTPSGKVEKFRLRERGVSATTWDREQAGIELRRV